MTTLTPQIKKELSLAFPGTKFSVKKGTGGLETQYTISYTDGPAESLVRNLTDKFQSIRYDKASDEILSGCNTFVSIDRLITPEAKAVYKAVMVTLGYTDHAPHCNHAMYAYNIMLKAVMEMTKL